LGPGQEPTYPVLLRLLSEYNDTMIVVMR